MSLEHQVCLRARRLLQTEETTGSKVHLLTLRLRTMALFAADPPVLPVLRKRWELQFERNGQN
jgi:hypothetical protein